MPVNDVGVEIVMVGVKHDYSNHSNRFVTRIKSVKWELKYFGLRDARYSLKPPMWRSHMCVHSGNKPVRVKHYGCKTVSFLKI